MTRELFSALTALAGMTHPSPEKLLRRDGYTVEADAVAAVTSAFAKFLQRGDPRPYLLEDDDPPAPRCGHTSFVAGGRDQRVCGELADPEMVCVSCGAARCEQHAGSLEFAERNGAIFCADCAENQPT